MISLEGLLELAKRLHAAKLIKLAGKSGGGLIGYRDALCQRVDLLLRVRGGAVKTGRIALQRDLYACSSQPLAHYFFFLYLFSTNFMACRKKDRP